MHFELQTLDTYDYTTGKLLHDFFKAVKQINFCFAYIL